MSKKQNKSSETVDINIKIVDRDVSIEDMDEVSLVNFLDQRYTEMSTAPIRQKMEEEWDLVDKQYTAITVRDNYWNLLVNLPMEQNLIDTYEGRNAGKLVFDIQPDWKQADVDELQPAQYALEYYLEGWDNRGSWFYEIAPILRRSKAKYGTAFAFVWLENNKQLKYKIKDDAEISDIADLENKQNYEPYIVDSREFFPKDLDIRSVFVDEKVLNQPNIQKAEDAFIEKMISLNKIKFIRKDNGYKNLEKLTESTQKDNNKNNKDMNATWQVLIRFYYNNLSKDYVIYAPDQQVLIHRSKMLYNHGRLPIESVQHYNDDNCLYGIGICKKVRYLKGFKSEIMQAILDNAAQSTWLNFVIGNWWEIGDWSVGGNGVNIWRTTVGAEEIKQIQPQINIWLASILNILDDLVVQDTGENVRAMVDVQTDKVGILEMMEENKAIRHKSVDSNRSLFLDRTLTMMLNNIAQFVPSLLSKTTIIKQWKEEIKRIEYPYIRIHNAVVKKKNGKMIIDKEDNFGKLGYFELKPWSISEGLWVKIVTPYSTSILPLIKKDAITKRMDNKIKLANIASIDQTGEMMEQLKATIKISEVDEWINDTYWFEDKLKSKTWKDKQKEINMRKVEKLRMMMEWWPVMEENLVTNQMWDAWQNIRAPMIGEEEEAPISIEDQSLQNKPVGKEIGEEVWEFGGAW